MRPDEVMIGDWLLFTDPDTGETGPAQIDKDDIGFDNEEFWDLFKPIPITPETLEDNGFVKTERNYHILQFGEVIFGRSPTGEYYADGRGPYNFIKIYNLYLKYVHELQHALILAGLYDLAINFKIKEGGEK